MASKPTLKAKPAAAQAMAGKKSAKSAMVRPSPGLPPKPTAATITLRIVFEEMAQKHGLSKTQAHSLLAEMVEQVTAHLKNGDRIRMSGLGTLEVRQRDARTGRNPATGEAIQIAASKKVAFRVAKELKGAV